MNKPSDDSVASMQVRRSSGAVSELRRALAERKLRRSHFPTGIFMDPAWDLMIELYAFWLQGEHPPAWLLCSRADVSLSNGLRWINALCEQGFAEKLNELPGNVQLSAAGADAICAYFEAVREAADRNGFGGPGK